MSRARDQLEKAKQMFDTHTASRPVLTPEASTVVIAYLIDAVDDLVRSAEGDGGAGRDESHEPH